LGDTKTIRPFPLIAHSASPVEEKMFGKKEKVVSEEPQGKFWGFT